jgi:hypothetical protein
MKKLAITGVFVITIVASLVVVQGAAGKPSTVPPAQYHALMFRESQSQQQLTLERARNERFAVGNPERYGGPVPQDGIVAVTLERGLNERFASDNPVKQDLLGSTPSPPSSVESSDFQWGDAGIGAGVLLGAMALLGTCLVAFRHRGQLRTS